MDVVQVGLWIPTPSLWAWYSPTCGVLALPQLDLPALALSAQAPRVLHWVSMTVLMVARDLAFCVCVYSVVCVCVCVCVCV